MDGVVKRVSTNVKYITLVDFFDLLSAKRVLKASLSSSLLG
jgi:hypothetical protein